MNVERGEPEMMWFSNVLDAIGVETRIVEFEQEVHGEASLSEGGRTG